MGLPHDDIITAGELAAIHNDADVRILDCRFRLVAPDHGYQLWCEGHIPNAAYADLERDLSGPVSANTGRHPLPEASAFAAWCRSQGIDQHSRVVCYDDASGAFAARLWWMLAVWFGHPDVRVLDGGYDHWVRGGYPVSTTNDGTRPPTGWQPQPRWEFLVATDDIASIVAAEEAAMPILDARTTARFRGNEEPIDPVAGHIPGALNRPFGANLDTEGCWLPAEILHDELAPLAGGQGELIHMCGSGVTACHNALACARAGLGEGALRLYAGSWSEWITDVTRPVASS